MTLSNYSGSLVHQGRVGCHSKAPMSQSGVSAPAATGRGIPRWSVERVQLIAGTASIAGLLGSRAWVQGACPELAEGPPLSARESSIGSPERSAPQLPPSTRLLMFTPTVPFFVLSAVEPIPQFLPPVL